MNAKAHHGVARLASALGLALMLGACATAGRAPTSAHERGAGSGSSLARDCAGTSIGLLKVAVFGLPLSFEIAEVCMSGARASAAVAPAAGVDHSALAHAGPSEVRKLSHAESSVFPQSATSGCATPYCLGYR